MPPATPDDDLLTLLDDVSVLGAAHDEDGVLRALVEAACRVTRSQTGAAGTCDGAVATAEAGLDMRRGWTGGRRRWEAGEGAPGRVCATGLRYVGADPAAASAPGEAPGPAGGYVACLPLAAPRGFLEVRRGSAYDDRDAALLASLCRLATARLRELEGGLGRSTGDLSQADVADRLQRRLLPGEPPGLPGLEIAFAYRSASAGVLSGGDFVDYYARPPSSSLAFAIGDVAGKGVEAMAVTFVTKFILRAAVLGGQLSWPINPGEALQELRTALLEQPDFGEDTERFVTVLFGLLSVRNGTLELASAGHPTPFVVRAGGVERPLLLTEPAIGVELGAALAPYPTETLDVERGDVIVLFTDGITETRDAQGRFFEDEMGGLLAGCHDLPAGEVVRRLLEAAETFSARPAADDRALLCIRLTGEG